MRSSIQHEVTWWHTVTGLCERVPRHPSTPWAEIASRHPTTPWAETAFGHPTTACRATAQRHLGISRHQPRQKARR